MSDSIIGKRVTRNTIMLYMRMLFSVCVNLYISRTLLSVLGVDDFGVYNIVGGVVLMLGFINNSMSGCTSRFLAYELGTGDKDKLQTTFSSALYVHIIIACFVLLIGETLGLWFVSTQIEIPEGRMVAAQWVYQFSLFSAVFSFVQVPYSADVIAHERMDTYAFIEIMNVLLKLAVVFIVTALSTDKLITYAILLSCVAAVVFLTYRWYCRKHFVESDFRRGIDKTVLFPMIKFSGWDLYGNGAVLIQQQGVNILINRFFGVALNAATGVATQASSAVSMFVSSFTMALRPPIIKKYAAGDIEGMQKLLTVAIVLCVFLAEIVCLPLYLRIDFLMDLWLKDVPPYAIEFCKWMLLVNSIAVVNTLFTAVIHATGRIKGLSLITGSLYILTAVLTYFAFRYDSSPVAAYIISLVIAVCVLATNITISKNLIPKLSLSRFLIEIARPLCALTITIGLSIGMGVIMPHNFWGFLGVFFANAVCALSILYVMWVGPKFGWKIKTFLRNEI